MRWKRLRNANPEAYEYLVNLTDQEKKDIKYTGDRPDGADESWTPPDVLAELFNWALTPQGREYWADVNLDFNLRPLED